MGCKTTLGTSEEDVKLHSGRVYFKVYHYNDIKELGSEAEVKAKGKARQEGKYTSSPPVSSVVSQAKTTRSRMVTFVFSSSTLLEAKSENSVHR
jgi:hypothetical protein